MVNEISKSGHKNPINRTEKLTHTGVVESTQNEGTNQRSSPPVFKPRGKTTLHAPCRTCYQSPSLPPPRPPEEVPPGRRSGRAVQHLGQQRLRLQRGDGPSEEGWRDLRRWQTHQPVRRRLGGGKHRTPGGAGDRPILSRTPHPGALCPALMQKAPTEEIFS